MQVEAADQSRSGEHALGLLAAAFAATAWGLGAILARLASGPPMVLSFYRLWVGALFLLAVLFASGRRLSWGTLRASLLGGVLVGVDITLFFAAIRLTSIADATVIGAMQPAIILVVARPLFGERMARVDVFWTVVAMGGVAIAVLAPGAKSRDELAGDLLAVGSLLAWSAYWLAAKHARAGVDALDYTAGVITVAALALTPVVFLTRQPLGDVTRGSWLWICLLALVPGMAHVLMNWAHRFVDASISAVVASSNPIVACGVAVVVLGQPLTVLQVVGGVIGVAAVAVVAGRNRQPAEPPIAD